MAGSGKTLLRLQSALIELYVSVAEIYGSTMTNLYPTPNQVMNLCFENYKNSSNMFKEKQKKVLRERIEASTDHTGVS